MLSNTKRKEIYNYKLKKFEQMSLKTYFIYNFKFKKFEQIELKKLFK